MTTGNKTKLRKHRQCASLSSLIATLILMISPVASAEDCNKYAPPANKSDSFNYVRTLSLANNESTGIECTKKLKINSTFVEAVARELPGARIVTHDDRMRAVAALTEAYRTQVLLTSELEDLFGPLAQYAERPDVLQRNSDWQGGTTYQLARQPIMNCTSRSNKCDDLYSVARDSLAFRLRINSLGDDSRTGAVQEEVVRFARRDAQWQAYLDSQQFQYVWELGTNYCYHHPEVGKKHRALSQSSAVLWLNENLIKTPL